MPRSLLLFLVLLTFNGSSQAASPYAGEESRAIKALSPADISAYLAGEGMGLAKAAELNGYPGPIHVLELADDLGLTAEQQAQTEVLFKDMKSRAVALGEELVEAERTLDKMFSDRSVTADSLEVSLNRIAALQGEIRRVHLATHLRQTALLTDEQVAAYVELRGYHHLARGEGHAMHHNNE